MEETQRLARAYKQIASEDKLPITKLRLKIQKETARFHDTTNYHKPYHHILNEQSTTITDGILCVQLEFEHVMVKTRLRHNPYTVEIPTKVCTHKTFIPFADYWKYQLSAEYRNACKIIAA